VGDPVPPSPVLVTGANGFIGSALCRALRDRGADVRGLVLSGTDTRVLDEMHVPFHTADICEPDSLPGPLAGVKTVFHLAALVKDWGPREAFRKVNTDGTRNVLAAAAHAGATRFVHMSTLAVHRFTGHVDADENVPADAATFGYGASKIEAERLVRAAHAAGRLETTIVRPGAVIFGPRDTTAFVHLAPALERGALPLVDGGRPLTCYSYAENLADGLIAAAARPEASGETFVITDDLKIRLGDLFGALCEELGAPRSFRSVPAPLALAAGWLLDALWRLAGAKDPPPAHRYRVGIVARDFHFSCAKAKRVLGYAPRVPLREGLRRTVAWYREWRAARDGSR
jgi:nucleoside-diphosphate-sugar epimerase